MVEYLHETVHASDRCKYPSKQCPNKRAKKLNGEPHKLCEEHRQQANRNQKRLQERRRMRKFQEMQLYVLGSFTPQASEPSESSECQVVPTTWSALTDDACRDPDVDGDKNNPNACGSTGRFWGYFDSDSQGDSSWSGSLGTLSPLRVDDDDQLREFPPDDLSILYALLFEPQSEARPPQQSH